jgi:hypothetical protein
MTITRSAIDDRLKARSAEHDRKAAKIAHLDQMIEDGLKVIRQMDQAIGYKTPRLEGAFLPPWLVVGIYSLIFLENHRSYYDSLMT